MRNLGITILSALVCASLIGACSASGNDPVETGGGPGTGATDSGAAADTSYSYDAGPDNVIDSGSTGTKTPIDSGTVTVIDSGPSASSNDCDLSGGLSAFGYFEAAQSGGDGACNATDDSCSSASDCCVNIATFIGGGGSLPSGFGSLLGGSPTCVAR